MARLKCLVIFTCLVLHSTNAQYFDDKPTNPFTEGASSLKSNAIAPKPSNTYLPVEGSESNPVPDKYLPAPEGAGSDLFQKNVLPDVDGKQIDSEDLAPEQVLPPLPSIRPAPRQPEPPAFKVAPQLGCAAALLCVEEVYCTMTGVISETPVRLTDAQLLRRVPMVDCRNPENGIVGKCCRDPNYEDPWPNGGSLPVDYKGGFDNNGFPLIFNYNYTSTRRPLLPRPTRPAPVERPALPEQSLSQPNVVGPSFNRPTYTRPSTVRPPLQPVTFPIRPVPSSQQPPLSFPQPVTPLPTTFFVRPSSTQPPAVPNFVQSGSSLNAAELSNYDEDKDVSGQEFLGTYQGQPVDVYKVGQQSKPFDSSLDVQTVQQQTVPLFEAEDNAPELPVSSESPVFASSTPTVPAPTKPPTYAPPSTIEPFQKPLSQEQFTFNYAPPFILPHTPGAQCGLVNKVQSAYGLNDAEVPFGTIPWQAMVLALKEKRVLCSGAFVTPAAVITAASCVYDHEATDISVKSGEWKLGYELKHEEPLPYEIVSVQRMFVHPNFRPGVAGYDIAILILEKPVKLDQHVDTICLGLRPQMLTPQTKCMSTGWGKNIIKIHAAGAIMNKVDLTLMDNSECRNRLRNAESYLELDVSLMCARTTYQKNNLCQVDPGGPLACDRGDGFYELIGVYSQDTGCLPTNQVATFTMIDYPWVHSVLEGRPYYSNQFDYEGPAPYLGQSSNQPNPFRAPSGVHYHQPGVPCDCRQGSLPAGLNKYLPPQ